MSELRDLVFGIGFGVILIVNKHFLNFLFEVVKHELFIAVDVLFVVKLRINDETFLSVLKNLELIVGDLYWQLQ